MLQFLCVSACYYGVTDELQLRSNSSVTPAGSDLGEYCQML